MLAFVPPFLGRDNRISEYTMSIAMAVPDLAGHIFDLNWRALTATIVTPKIR